mmetsp:Transcript_5642/g.7320  ORF Transcript_5642/g.7320 Transcript_5642/m.7320 type:complete len:131 (+) Transcript_5642:236-628(+)|eukprot:CAMPEP_0201485542 /NCGR_PEP_ID=MMETSP0151_2-20130828/9636_1 /ASSEMBLY_ACC=CAM_ASM_000257 /TAXON_ID=200890 /ORGANISM="Paramoeba atlantica, Strain 621/1 / CCAP 1560/9" /LENGTH=130 /DNA_ID=CAMNT_0047869715 /DNA_START=239 /DNA_END=631 /DNA_ORIENTATION=+
MEPLDSAEKSLDGLERKVKTMISYLKQNLDTPFGVHDANQELLEIYQLLDALESTLSSMVITGLHVFDEETQNCMNDPLQFDQKIEGFYENTSGDLKQLDEKKKKIHSTIQLLLRELMPKDEGRMMKSEK